ncbi:hypothetical protein AQI95_43595 [Streptomyces yokosukanensis]|uniref:Uncharacterized protein n=1 Tax=Streptomyces yokosukanensis TaxID=67386 RepID=A0A101NJZ0_9ACTN|nr:hypothetical protein [Streptomyces yokosukanensis]KUM94291.1 hypothetical protein AQI95_43595 [Streptomyces yokosukanensis]
MTHAIPVLLPSALVNHHAIDLERRYTDGWGLKVDDVATTPSGEIYALSHIHRHTYGVANEEAAAAKAHFGYSLVNRYAPDGTLLATAVSGQDEYLRQDTTFGGPTTGLGMDLWWAKGLCVLPGGTLAATGSGDHTHLITADLTAVTAHHGMPRSRHDDGPRDPFAAWISTTPAGRLLCTTGEYGLYNYGNLLDNIVSVTDQPLTPTSKPTLRALASMAAEPVKHTEADLRPDVLFDDKPVGMDHRPRPSLTEHLTGLEQTARRWDWDDARLGRPAVVREDLFVVPVYGHIYRGGSRGQRFAFVLVSDKGEFVGQLGGMDLYRDSPFTGFCFEIAADAARERIYHLNRYGLFAWTATGVRAQRLDLEDTRYKLLKHFTLADCTPTGELILVHRTQHLMLRIPCPTALGDLGQVVENALRAYAKERTALKKQSQPVNWHWLNGTAPLHRL